MKCIYFHDTMCNHYKLWIALLNENYLHHLFTLLLFSHPNKYYDIQGVPVIMLQNSRVDKTHENKKKSSCEHGSGNASSGS